jgi:pimeloyl-ACP methyl ester carboxylesterase
MTEINRPGRSVGVDEINTEAVELRVHDGASMPTLVYLPGVHGDWTLIGGFRRALRGRVRFVEVTYPRTKTWRLEDYAGAVAESLSAHGIVKGWVLAESFGSQVFWPLLKQGKFAVEGVILAGGFARHPAPWMASLAAVMAGNTPFTVIRKFFAAYEHVARFRFRNSPETLANIREFVGRRTMEDCLAMRHRLKLVAANDPRLDARRIRLPVYALTGLFDPIVPWYPALRWLRRNCQALREDRVIWRADHNVLGTAPEAAAAQVLEWLSRSSTHDRRGGIC